LCTPNTKFANVQTYNGAGRKIALHARISILVLLSDEVYEWSGLLGLFSLTEDGSGGIQTWLVTVCDPVEKNISEDGIQQSKTISRTERIHLGWVGNSRRTFQTSSSSALTISTPADASRTPGFTSDKLLVWAKAKEGEPQYPKFGHFDPLYGRLESWTFLDRSLALRFGIHNLFSTLPSLRFTVLEEKTYA